MAEFAASAAQGHIGRAKYLATNEEARKIREKILNIPFTVKDLASAFEAANTLVELAKSQALAESEVRDEAELAKLKESYGTTGSKLATGGSKAVKELEKQQKLRSERIKKDFIYSALITICEEFAKSLNSGLLNIETQNFVGINSINTVLKNNGLNTALNMDLLLESLFTSFIVKNARI
jgi:hypothetical protein